MAGGRIPTQPHHLDRHPFGLLSSFYETSCYHVSGCPNWETIPGTPGRSKKITIDDSRLTIEMYARYCSDKLQEVDTLRKS